MIVPMKKCHIVMMDGERAQGLKALRKLGLLHTEETFGSGKALDDLRSDRELLERSISTLSTRKAAKMAIPTAKKEGIPDAMALAGKLDDLAATEKALAERSAYLVKERDRIADWGDFSPGDFLSLESCGKTARLHALPQKPKPVFPNGFDSIALGAAKGKSYFLSMAPKGTDMAGMPESIVLPEKSLAEMNAEIESIKKEIIAVESGRDALAPFLPRLREALKKIEQEEKFENLRSGMGSQETISYLSGWVPLEDLPAVKEEAARRGWALSDDDPADDEMPPTKVRNNPIVRIIQPVFDFLGTVPNYREYEISAWFMIFFCVFFAMIFGDAGYGLIMLAAVAFLFVSAIAKRKKIPDAVFLLGLLAFVTVAWGAMTGSWFSLPESALPAFLKALAIEQIAGWNPESGDNIKILCFILGAVQLSIAHVKNMMRDRKSLKFLGQLGSLILVISMLFLVFNLVIDSQRFPLKAWVPYAIGAGFVLVFAFSNYEGKILKSIIDGFKNIIPTFLGTVSVFADIVSYIRLWAVGLAGVAISQTVNGMGGGLFSPTGIILKIALNAVFGIIILGIGHSLNLVMSVLSVVVHGVRLNILEFSGHLGMEWSGYKYDPFKESYSHDKDSEKERI